MCIHNLGREGDSKVLKLSQGSSASIGVHLQSNSLLALSRGTSGSSFSRQLCSYAIEGDARLLSEYEDFQAPVDVLTRLDTCAMSLREGARDVVSA